MTGVPNKRPGSIPGPFSHRLQSQLTSAQWGFSLVELVVTLILIGIMSAIFMPRWNGDTGFDQLGFRDSVAAALRYAQKSAIAARLTTCANFTTVPAQVDFRISSINGAADCTAGSSLVGPDGLPLVVKATGTIGFSSVPASVVFDAAGRSTAAATISVSGLPGSRAITVEAETGYVH